MTMDLAMDEQENTVLVELDGSVTVILGYDERPKSPQPLPSPCTADHAITPLIKESEKPAMERESEVIVVRSIHSCTPLSAAVVTKRNDAVRSMLEEGVLVEVLHQQDCSGSPVLCSAAYHGNVEAAKMLLQYGAPVDTVTKHGLTPLCIASGSDSVAMMRMLLVWNGDINKRAIDGTSPIHIAAERGQVNNLNALLDERQLDPSLVFESYRDQDIYCPSAVVLAAVNNRQRVLDILMQRFSLPPKVTCDVLLIRWARECLLSVCQGKNPNDETLRLGLKIGQNNEVHIPRLAPLYGDIVEVTSYDEFEETAKREGLFWRICQALIVLHRTAGLSNKVVVSKCLMPCAKALAEAGCHGDAELLLCRALECMPLTERLLSARGVDMMPSHLHVTFGLFIPHFCSLMSIMKRRGHTVQWLPIVDGVDAILSTLLQLMARQPCQDARHWNEAYRRDILFLFSTICCALASDGKLPKDFVKSVVSKYTEYVSDRFTSPLHLALHGAAYITRTLRHCGYTGSMGAYVLLIRCLLECTPCLISSSFAEESVHCTWQQD